jgi:hypothetical protein
MQESSLPAGIPLQHIDIIVHKKFTLVIIIFMLFSTFTDRLTEGIFNILKVTLVIIISKNRGHMIILVHPMCRGGGWEREKQIILLKPSARRETDIRY